MGARIAGSQLYEHVDHHNRPSVADRQVGKEFWRLA